MEQGNSRHPSDPFGKIGETLLAICNNESKERNPPQTGVVVVVVVAEAGSFPFLVSVGAYAISNDTTLASPVT